MDTYERLAAAVLVAHQRHRGGCLCGWSELGRSHADHVASVLAAAGALQTAPAHRTGRTLTMPYLTKTTGHGVNTTGLSPHPARCAAQYPVVVGACPSCGNESLFLADGGYVTCAILRCPDSGAASDLLERGRND